MTTCRIDRRDCLRIAGGGLAAGLLPVDRASGQNDDARIEVRAGNILHRITGRIIGTNIEDLNCQCYGGLYSQLLYGENFEEHVAPDFLGLSEDGLLRVSVYVNDEGIAEIRHWLVENWGPRRMGDVRPLVFPASGVLPVEELPPDLRRQVLEKVNGPEQISRHWGKLQRGSAKGRFTLIRKGTFNGRQSQQISYTSGEGEFGIDNMGVNRWGIHLRAGKPYEGLVRIRAPKPCSVFLSLLSADGNRKLAQKAVRLSGNPNQYQRVEFELTPDKSDRKGRFAITLTQPGAITVGYAFLQPGPWGRFKGQPIRKDLAEAVLRQGVTVMRYNGSMVNRCHQGQLYKWKEMIGPRDLRKPYKGWFNHYASHGFGVVELTAFCKAAGILAVPGLRIDETPEDMAGFVEYMNGPADSEWGSKRAADGYPEPLGLTHIQIGNEERLNAHYCERFEILGKAIWSKDPKMVVAVSHNLSRAPDEYRIGPGGERGELLENALRICRFAQDSGGAIWWDSHYTGRDLREMDNPNNRLQSMRALRESVTEALPGFDLDFSPLEENGDRHDMFRALAHARNIQELSRMGEWIVAAGVANTFQAYRQDRVWPQGRTFFTASKVWHQPPYYVDQMIHRNPGSLLVESLASGPKSLDVLARKSEDGQALMLQVVNIEASPVNAELLLGGFQPASATATVSVLQAPLDGVNTEDAPEAVAPVTTRWQHNMRNGRARRVFPPFSFTLIRFE